MKKTFLTLILLLIFTSVPKAQTCDMFIGGYVPSYRNPATVDYSKLSHVFYAFASTNNDGGLLVENEASAFVAFKSASTGTQRFLSLAAHGEDVTDPLVDLLRGVME